MEKNTNKYTETCAEKHKEKCAGKSTEICTGKHKEKCTGKSTETCAEKHKEKCAGKSTEICTGKHKKKCTEKYIENYKEINKEKYNNTSLPESMEYLSGKIPREQLIRKVQEMAERGKSPYSQQMTEQVLQLLGRGVPVSELLQELRLQDRKVQINYVSSRGEDEVSLHSHVFYELLYVAGGSVDYLLGSQRYRIRQGDLVFIPPGVNHCPLFPDKPEAPYVRYTVWYDAGYFEELCGQCQAVAGIFEACMRRNQFLLCSGEDGSRTLELLCENLYRETIERRPGWELKLAAGSINLLVAVGRTYFLQGEQKAPENSLVEEILCHIDAHLGEKLTLEEVSRHFHVSTSTITHLFRRELSTPFYRCVVERRLLAAKYKMLRGVPLHQVCEECGFPDYSAFYRLFKKEYGLSPREYCRLHPGRRAGA